ncbi:MAG: NAD(P)-dependent oxidoreductase [Ectothiorhodospiraceae bacterium]|nr:NAD(P)-dependent oxidoreductase [Ectothiorhodospiraceae bacterium]
MITVGVIGLGNMGGAMARCLARKGFRVLGTDVVPQALARSAAAGVETGADIPTIAATADVLLSVLPDSPEVEACLLGAGGAIAAARAGTVLVECSTVAPATTDRAAAAAAARGLGFLDAAMGRSPIQAETGNLLFMVGGSDADLARARPVLEATGDTIQHCGPVGTGIRTKLVMNLLSQSTCQLSAEVVALGLKMGLDREALLAVLGSGLGANGFITQYWPAKVLAGDTSPGFAIRLSAKDLRHAVSMAAQAGVDIPTGAAAAAAVNAAARTHGDLDVSGMLTVACEHAGVPASAITRKDG